MNAHHPTTASHRLRPALVGLLLLAGCAAAPTAPVGADLSTVPAAPDEAMAADQQLELVPADPADPADDLESPLLVAFETQASPPWPRPGDEQTRANIAAAGLDYMAAGHANVQMHIHAYLQIFHEGQRVQLPANLGIVGGKMATLHTHATDGTVHMEGPRGMRFRLGQVFQLWGVPLSGAKVYHGGVLQRRAARIRLKDKLTLTIVFGAPPRGVGLKALDGR